jgi:hypothetical protein
VRVRSTTKQLNKKSCGVRKSRFVIAPAEGFAGDLSRLNLSGGGNFSLRFLMAWHVVRFMAAERTAGVTKESLVFAAPKFARITL